MSNGEVHEYDDVYWSSAVILDLTESLKEKLGAIERKKTINDQSSERHCAYPIIIVHLQCSNNEETKRTLREVFWMIAITRT